MIRAWWVLLGIFVLCCVVGIVIAPPASNQGGPTSGGFSINTGHGRGQTTYKVRPIQGVATAGSRSHAVDHALASLVGEAAGKRLKAGRR